VENLSFRLISIEKKVNLRKYIKMAAIKEECDDSYFKDIDP